MEKGAAMSSQHHEDRENTLPHKEHLYPDTLAAIPDFVVGYMQPRVVVFTTPNADFNVLFPDFTGFRHWDHKFEWSREEFQCWYDKVAKDFSYSVSYDGIGPGPPGTEHLGCCTQWLYSLAYFHHTRAAHTVMTEILITLFVKLITHIEER
ncbi:small RNA 2'-O-methyltransferase-like [Asterias amurensis]|uniref:small RNA 2'-O-methyltransferase-like n=1 Tax=Asterias amurensis TaxID=7602 RepID=UPI003AB7500D